MPSRILVIDGHPDPDRARFCHALAEAYADGARSTGKEARLITLADLDIPLLRTAHDFTTPPTAPDILRARDDMQWADHVVLVFPLWLGGAPSLLHAFLEQAARGAFFAETDGKGIRSHFKGRSARVIVTMGMPDMIFRLVFRAHGVKAIMSSILGFAGFAPVRMNLFGGVGAVTRNVQLDRLGKVRALGCGGS